DPRAPNGLSISNLADDCIASAVPIIPIAQRRRTMRKVRPSHARDTCDWLLTSKSFRLKPQNREDADRVTVWPPDDSGTRHDHHRHARRKENSMWKEMSRSFWTERDPACGSS